MCPPPFARLQSRKPPLLMLKKTTSLPCWLGWSRSTFMCTSSAAPLLPLLGIPLPSSLRCAAVVVADHGRRPPFFHLWLHQKRSRFVRCAASCTLVLGFHFLFPVLLPWLVASTALHRCFRYLRFRVSFSSTVVPSSICCLLPLLNLPLFNYNTFKNKSIQSWEYIIQCAFLPLINYLVCFFYYWMMRINLKDV